MKPGPQKQYPKRVEFQIDEPLLSKLDAWCDDQRLDWHGKPYTRSEAIRLAIKQMVEK